MSLINQQVFLPQLRRIYPLKSEACFRKLIDSVMKGTFNIVNTLIHVNQEGNTRYRSMVFMFSHLQVLGHLLIIITDGYRAQRLWERALRVGLSQSCNACLHAYRVILSKVRAFSFQLKGQKQVRYH